MAVRMYIYTYGTAVVRTVLSWPPTYISTDARSTSNLHRKAWRKLRIYQVPGSRRYMMCCNSSITAHLATERARSSAGCRRPSRRRRRLPVAGGTAAGWSPARPVWRRSVVGHLNRTQKGRDEISGTTRLHGCGTSGAEAVRWCSASVCSLGPRASSIISCLGIRMILCCARWMIDTSRRTKSLSPPVSYQVQ